MEQWLLKIETFKFESHVYNFICVDPLLDIKIVISMTHNYAIKFITDNEKHFIDFTNKFASLCNFDVLKTENIQSFTYESQLIDGNPGHFARKPIVFKLVFTNPNPPYQKKELTLTINYNKGLVTISD